MKVSVIIPVYNVEYYIEECMTSIVNQTIDEIEIIAVDDGTRDQSGEICDNFAKKYNNVVVIHKENGGQASARNAALKIANGEYIGFVDGDDWVDLEMYDTMYNVAKKEDSDIVICDMVDHYPERTVYHHSSVYDDVFKVTPSACNKIFRKELIENDEFPSGLWYEDFEFTTKQLLKTKKISNVHKGLYHCHCREVSVMFNNDSEKNLDIITVLDHLRKYIADNGYEQEHSELMEYLVIEHILITSINRVERQDNAKKKSVIKTMRKYVKGNYPTVIKDDVFKKMPRNRRIIAYLNYLGLENVSGFILNMKKNMK